MSVSGWPRAMRGVFGLFLSMTFLHAGAALAGKPSEDDVPPAVRAVAKNLTIAQTIGPSGGGLTNDLGVAVAVTERFAAIGVADGSGPMSATPQSGVVYVYQRVNGVSPFRFLGIVAPPANREVGERFGESVAFSGNLLLVGAPNDTDDPQQVARAGSVYVFGQATRTGAFGFVQKLDASAATLAADGNLFGRSVAAAGNHVFVGVPGADAGATNAGAVAVFTCVRFPSTICTHRTNLAPSDPYAGGGFGFALAAALPPRAPGAGLVVGAPGQCRGTTCAANAGEGAAYVYLVPPSGPIPAPTKIGASDGVAGDRFGQAVAMDGIGAAIGVPMDDGGIGSVRLFFRAPGGIQTGQVLRPPTGVVDPMRFGSAVSNYRNFLAIGAPLRTVPQLPAARTGSLFLFERSNNQWFQRDEIFRTVSPVSSDVNFGRAVAIGGGVLVVGEPDGPGATFGTPGRAYVYLTGRSARIDRIANPNAAPESDNYGTDVAISNGFLAVGLPNRDAGATPRVGEVRIYQQGAAGGPFVPTNQAVLSFPEAALANARYGHAVALTANATHLIVGAPGALNGGAGATGAVYVYQRQGTSFVPATPFKRVRPNAGPNEDFGASLDVSRSANLLVVGAPNADQIVGGVMTADVGAVTIFRDPSAPAPKSGLVGRAKFDDGGNVPPPAGGGIGDKWGSSVATDGDQVVAGAPEPGAGGDGYATVIDDGGTGNFDNTDTMTPPADAGPGDEQDFGMSVDIDDGMVAVGAPGTDMADPDSGGMNADEGVAYGYDVDDGGGASDPTTMDQPGGGLGDKWGSSVSIDDGGVATGGPGYDVPTDGADSVDQGAVSTYECYFNDLGEIVCEIDETLFGKNATADEAIGTSIDGFDGELVLGAPDAGAADEGAVYTTEDLFLIDGIFRDGFE